MGFGGRVKGKGSFKGRGVLRGDREEGGSEKGRGDEKKRRRKRDWVEVKKRFVRPVVGSLKKFFRGEFRWLARCL